MKKVVLAALFLVFGVACASKSVVTPVTRSVPVNLELKKVQDAIISGGQARNWTSKVTGANTVELTQNSRGHVVVVNVEYTQKDYKITYKDSTNMKYDPAKNTIHGKYGKWLAKLTEAIDARLK